MKGKVKFAKFPPGLYYCQIEDVKAGINSKQEEIMVITYRIQAGERKDQTFKERLKSVSSMFLKGIGEPSELNADWDTERWRGKFLWVDVKYSLDEAQWPRFGHHQHPPAGMDVPPAALPGAVPPGAGPANPEDEIPF